MKRALILVMGVAVIGMVAFLALRGKQPHGRRPTAPALSPQAGTKSLPTPQLVNPLIAELDLEKLVKLLQSDPSPAVRMMAAKTLGEIGSAEGYAAVSSAAQRDENARVRFFAVTAMQRFPEASRETDLLRVARQDSDPAVVETAVGGLGSSSLQSLALDPAVPSGARSGAVERLGSAFPSECLKVYGSLDTTELKEEALRALGGQKDLGILQAAYAAESNEELRAEFIAAVRRGRPEGARSWLEWIATNDPSDQVRREADLAVKSYP